MFLTVGIALICCSCSIAVTPAVRSTRFPRGVPGMTARMRQTVKEGNSHAEFVAYILEICVELCICFWLENPDTSWLWRQKLYAKYRSSASYDLFRFSFCRFGTAWRKNTRIATDIPGLKGLRLGCICDKGHNPLRGYSSVHKISWTAVAEPYPGGLNRLLAAACCVAGKWAKFQRLDISACCRSLGPRVGEASNPGPRRVKRRDDRNLLDIPLVSNATAAFVSWCCQEIPDSVLAKLFDLSPLFLCQVVCAYGKELFAAGGALSNFRHLVIAVQQWKPASRAFMVEAWQLVSRWEVPEPVQHRPPVPEVIVLAMVVMAWQMEWFAWAGVTLLALFGAGRVGEVLKCGREDLLLPSDTCGEIKHSSFLKLQAFKALGRQPSRVQHMKIHECEVVKLLEVIYGNLDSRQLLYGASPAVYRRRWDVLLSLLGIPKELKLTPGGLRGGAGEHRYRTGMAISEILWEMHLRQQSIPWNPICKKPQPSVFSVICLKMSGNV